MINILLQKINNKYYLQLNDEIKEYDKIEFVRYSTLFSDWIIPKLSYKNENCSYQYFIVPEPDFNYRLQTYIYYYDILNDYIYNLNTKVKYKLNNRIKTDQMIHYKYGSYICNEVDEKKIFLFSEEFAILVYDSNAANYDLNTVLNVLALI